ncbi:hypothetical protein [Clostridium cuniculi]|uniref:hypothetical protein n=1 Tax=Clostridium cuniculi TaxID=2548455 RepID=UPI001056A738|nr:hypothetical protein [Clostridium cuniculi]
MINLEDGELDVIKAILGKLYLESGLTEEVILLNRIVDKVILYGYGELQFDNNRERNDVISYENKGK